MSLKSDDSLRGSVVRASLAARGVAIVDFPLPSPLLLGDGEAEDAPAAARLELAAAAAAVSRELYRRGMLSAAWEVGPAMAAAAIEGGHVQRALVRRRSRAGAGGVAAATATSGGRAVAAAAVGGAVSAGGVERSGCCAGVGDVCREEEERAALRVMRRLSGSEGVRVRRGGGGVFPWGSGTESPCIEVLLPAAGLNPAVALA